MAIAVLIDTFRLCGRPTTKCNRFQRYSGLWSLHRPLQCDVLDAAAPASSSSNPLGSRCADVQFSHLGTILVFGTSPPRRRTAFTRESGAGSCRSSLREFTSGEHSNLLILDTSLTTSYPGTCCQKHSDMARYARVLAICRELNLNVSPVSVRLSVRNADRARMTKGRIFCKREG